MREGKVGEMRGDVAGEIRENEGRREEIRGGIVGDIRQNVGKNY